MSSFTSRMKGYGRTVGFAQRVNQLYDNNKEVRQKAADKARDRITEMEDAKELLTYKSKLKKEEAQAEFEKYFGESGSYGELDTMLADLPTPVQNMAKGAIMQGDYKTAYEVMKSADTMTRSRRDQEIQEEDRKRSLTETAVNLKWKDDFNVEDTLADGDKSTLFIQPTSRVTRDTNIELQRAEGDYASIMEKFKEQFAARDADGVPTGTVDVDASKLSQATVQMIRARNTFRQAEDNKLDPALKQKYIDNAIEQAELADATFDSLGVDVTSYQYDDLFSVSDMKLFRKYGGEELQASIEDTEVPVTEFVTYKGKQYTVGDTVEVEDKEGNKKQVTLTQEQLDMMKRRLEK